MKQKPLWMPSRCQSHLSLSAYRSAPSFWATPKWALSFKEPYLLTSFLCVSSSAFSPPSLPPDGFRVTFLMLIMWPCSFLLSSTIAPCVVLQGQVFPASLLLLLLFRLLPSHSQWAQAPETATLFVAAEWGMGNDVAFTYVAGRHTQIAWNLHLPLAKHTHAGVLVGKGLCMCPVTHNPSGGYKSFLFKAFSLLQSGQKEGLK